MRIPPIPHRWTLSPRAAVAVQRRLATRVDRKGGLAHRRYVVGLDAAFSPDQRVCLAVAVCWDQERRALVEERWAQRPVRFPYSRSHKHCSVAR